MVRSIVLVGPTEEIVVSVKIDMGERLIGHIPTDQVAGYSVDAERVEFIIDLSQPWGVGAISGHHSGDLEVRPLLLKLQELFDLVDRLFVDPFLLPDDIVLFADIVDGDSDAPVTYRELKARRALIRRRLG